MGPVSTLDALYTSAPILDYDYEDRDDRPEGDELHEGPGAATLAPEQFDAAILAGLVSP